MAESEDDKIDKKVAELVTDGLVDTDEDKLEMLEKLGEGSYGSVWRARNRETGVEYAIKKLSVFDNDLDELRLEIAFMKTCDSPYVVKYFGSLICGSELWIAMEFAAAGSVADVMKVTRRTLAENQIAIVCKHVLLGLQYLHSKKKLHRDIKAGNVLLTARGECKLADFGVSGQLADTMAKRHTVTGTPYWMAPEVIQEVGYNNRADIWSLGITAIEVAEGKPPYADVHPMRAIFMIPSRPPPTLAKPDDYSPLFTHFVASCLTKDPQSRPGATELLEHLFIKNGPPNTEPMLPLIEEQKQVLAKFGRGKAMGFETTTPRTGKKAPVPLVAGLASATASTTTSSVQGTTVFHEGDTAPSLSSSVFITPDEGGDEHAAPPIEHAASSQLPPSKSPPALAPLVAPLSPSPPNVAQSPSPSVEPAKEPAPAASGQEPAKEPAKEPAQPAPAAEEQSPSASSSVVTHKQDSDTAEAKEPDSGEESPVAERPAAEKKRSRSQINRSFENLKKDVYRCTRCGETVQTSSRRRNRVLRRHYESCKAPRADVVTPPSPNASAESPPPIQTPLVLPELAAPVTFQLIPVKRSGATAKPAAPLSAPLAATTVLPGEEDESRAPKNAQLSATAPQVAPSIEDSQPSKPTLVEDDTQPPSPEDLSIAETRLPPGVTRHEPAIPPGGPHECLTAPPVAFTLEVGPLATSGSVASIAPAATSTAPATYAREAGLMFSSVLSGRPSARPETKPFRPEEADRLFKSRIEPLPHPTSGAGFLYVFFDPAAEWRCQIGKCANVEERLELARTFAPDMVCVAYFFCPDTDIAMAQVRRIMTENTIASLTPVSEWWWCHPISAIVTCSRVCGAFATLHEKLQ